MRGFRADVTGDAMIEGGRVHRMQAGRGRTANEPIEDDGDAFDTCAQHRTRHGGNLAPAQSGQRVQSVAPHVTRDTLGHDFDLLAQAGVIHASAPPDPIRGLAAV